MRSLATANSFHLIHRSCQTSYVSYKKNYFDKLYCISLHIQDTLRLLHSFKICMLDGFLLLYARVLKYRNQYPLVNVGYYPLIRKCD